MTQLYAVCLKTTGELVSVGDFVQDATHCICSHSSVQVPGHPVGTETITNPDGTKRTRPLGCTVAGCWHNYDVDSKGWDIKRTWRPGMATPTGFVPGPTSPQPSLGPTVWSDPTGLSDAPFVSDPLAADLIAVPIASLPTPLQQWNPVLRVFA